MIWFAWRQFRLQALIASGLLLALAIGFLVTGPHLLHTYDTAIVGCQARGNCSGAQSSFLSAYPFLQNVLTESGLLAVLIGIFWGAPVLSREFDTGTYRLAWTQSASRTRWLVAKLAVGTAASVVTAGLFTLMATWWSSPLDRLRDTPFSYFDTRDITPIGYALFGFMLGAAMGALVRRVIPAMVLTIAVFAAVRVSFNLYVRPHFETPLHGVFALLLPGAGSTRIGGGINSADWTLSNIVKNAAGKVLPQLSSGVGFRTNSDGSVTLVGAGRCPNKIPSSFGKSRGSSGPPKAVQEALARCVKSFHLHDVMTYQPVSRFWSFQWYELGSYVLLSALLAWFSVWWIRRR